MGDQTPQPRSPGSASVTDTDRDIYMTASEAKSYGLIDELLSKAEGK